MAILVNAKLLKFLSIMFSFNTLSSVYINCKSVTANILQNSLIDSYYIFLFVSTSNFALQALFLFMFFPQ